MSTRLRNPSPPPGDIEFLRNMSIWYLKPTFTLKPLELSLDLFNEKYFITPPESEDEVELIEIEAPSIKEQTSVFSSDTPKNLPVISKNEIYGPEAPERQEDTVKGIEDIEYIPIKTKKAPKKDDEKGVLKPKIVKKELSSDDERKRHHKRSKHKKKKLKVHTVTSESDESESSKPKTRHRSHKRYKQMSESEDYDVRDSRKTTRTKSHGRHKKRREYNLSDSESESNARSVRHHRRYKDYKKEPDGSDSDRSDSRGSTKVDRHSRYYKKEYDTPDSDSKRSEWNYKSYKVEPDDESCLSESKYDPQHEGNWDKTSEGGLCYGPGRYYCQVCQLELNSETTFQSHMNGKRHLKALKAQQIPEVVKGSLANLAMIKEALRPSGAQTNFVILNVVPRLHDSLAGVDKSPIIGLDYVEEIQSGKDTMYLCTLCDAPCMLSSITPHLIGFKHQMSYAKIKEPAFYNQLKECSKKEVTEKLHSMMFMHEKLYGRGKITVKAVLNPSGSVPFGEAGPSKIKPGIAKKEPLNRMDLSNTEAQGSGEIDPSIFEVTKNDYYCKLCDAHMNNFNMYSAHKVGKRHLKNEKKTAQERSTQINSTRAPFGTTSELETILKRNNEDIIVGLNFVRETQSLNGSLYTCYLCGSSGSIDIIDHLLTLKHRIRFLETVNENRSIPNSIDTINKLEVNSLAREGLVLEECEKIEKKYGRGKVELYVSKFGAK